MQSPHSRGVLLLQGYRLSVFATKRLAYKLRSGDASVALKHEQAQLLGEYLITKGRATGIEGNQPKRQRKTNQEG